MTIAFMLATSQGVSHAAPGHLLVALVDQCRGGALGVLMRQTQLLDFNSLCPLARFYMFYIFFQ